MKRESRDGVKGESDIDFLRYREFSFGVIKIFLNLIEVAVA